MTLQIDTSDIIRRWIAGDTTKQIAEDLKCCEATVRYRIKTRGHRMGPAQLDALTIERIQAMRAKGICPRSIAHELQVSLKSVYRHSNAHAHAEVLAELRDQLIAIKERGKIADTTKIEKQIEALTCILA